LHGLWNLLHIHGTFYSVLPSVKIQLSRGETWPPINWFKQGAVLCLSQARAWIANVICRGLFCVQWVQVRWEVIGRLLILVDWRLSLLELFFHDCRCDNDVVIKALSTFSPYIDFANGSVITKVTIHRENISLRRTLTHNAFLYVSSCFWRSLIIF